MVVKLYYTPASTPCRAVLMLSKAIDIDLELVNTDIFGGGNQTDEYLSMNPTHTVPTLDDDGFVLWESRAILIYLAMKFGDSILYPIDPVKQAMVNRMLFFDMGTLYQRFSEFYYPQIIKREDPDEEKLESCKEALRWFDLMLEGKVYCAGKNLTVADYSLLATYSTYEAMGFDTSEYPNVLRWYTKCQEEIEGYELNSEGLEMFKEWANLG